MSYHPSDTGALHVSDWFCPETLDEGYEPSYLPSAAEQKIIDEIDKAGMREHLKRRRQEVEERERKRIRPTPHEEEGNTGPPPDVAPVPPVLKRSKNGPRGRFWCFTLNNPTFTDQEHWVTYTETAPDIRFLTYGKETGASNTFHFQGYIEMNKTVSLAHLKASHGPRYHWELRKGTGEEAMRYCWKEDSEPYIWGTPSKGKGERTDLSVVQDDMDGGMSMREIATNHFGTFLRYNRGLAQYMSLTRQAKRRAPPKIQWLWGESGAGKSVTMTEIVEEMPVDDVYYVSTSPTGTWWGGYNGQSVVVMDDFRASWFPHNMILRLFDCVPMSVPYHGGYSLLQAERWIVTTNNPPHMVYKEDPAGALIRRVHDFATVYELRKNGYIECVGEPSVDASKTEMLCLIGKLVC